MLSSGVRVLPRATRIRVWETLPPHVNHRVKCTALGRTTFRSGLFRSAYGLYSFRYRIRFKSEPTAHVVLRRSIVLRRVRSELTVGGVGRHFIRRYSYPPQCSDRQLFCLYAFRPFAGFSGFPECYYRFFTPATRILLHFFPSGSNVNRAIISRIEFDVTRRFIG